MSSQTISLTFFLRDSGSIVTLLRPDTVVSEENAIKGGILILSSIV